MINKYAEIAYRLRLIKAANFMFKQALDSTYNPNTAFGAENAEFYRAMTGKNPPLDEHASTVAEQRLGKPKTSNKPFSPERYEQMIADRDTMLARSAASAREEQARLQNIIQERVARTEELSKQLGISKSQAAELQKQLETQTGLANRYSKEIDYNIDRYNSAMNKNKALQYKLDNVTGRHQRATKTISDMKKLHAQQMGAMDDSLKHMTHRVAEEQAAKKLLAQRAKYLKYGLIGTGATAAAMSIPAAYGAYSYFNN